MSRSNKKLNIKTKLSIHSCWCGNVHVCSNIKKRGKINKKNNPRNAKISLFVLNKDRCCIKYLCKEETSKGRFKKVTKFHDSYWSCHQSNWCSLSVSGHENSCLLTVNDRGSTHKQQGENLFYSPVCGCDLLVSDSGVCASLPAVSLCLMMCLSTGCNNTAALHFHLQPCIPLPAEPFISFFPLQHKC